MAQLVFEFISPELDVIVAAITNIVGKNPIACELAPTFVDYRPCATFEKAVNTLRSRQAVSLAMRTGIPNIRYALINAPWFNGAKMPVWFGCIEYTASDYKHIWNELLGSSLQVMCLGFEEGVVLDAMETLASKDFPWDAPELVIGAVRAANGEWEIRQGARYYTPENSW